eukprot:TRINITY_DN35637_c0_g1_i2.p1 TRINITY_DN35637_c0_g1~~TRINITY_DN35637_c0_g1_i2.p1  ORF type:complete len:229 (+),score=21.35 TRINITY_DN35637_c0_g1_i2:349-1035(+)
MFGTMNSGSTINYLSNVPGSYYKSDRISDSDNSVNGGNIELGYKHDFTKDSYLDFTASYNRWKMDNTSIYNQSSVYTDKTTSSYQRQLNNINNHNWEFQIDYQNKISDNTKLEAGYKGTLGRENSPVQTYSGAAESSATFNNDLYNRFIYNQDVHALYATYSGRVKKFGYQLGLRGEYSKPVSYTHLTLPTICSVQISVVAVSFKKKKYERMTENGYAGYSSLDTSTD